jgi:hypothetical protein
MSKQLSEDGVEYVHGRAIEIYEGKIAGAFPMEVEDAISLADGDPITLLVTVRTGVPKFFDIKKSGQLKCQNQFHVEEIQVLDPDKAKKMYDSLDTYVPGVSNPVTVTTLEPKDIFGFDPESLEMK